MRARRPDALLPHQSRSEHFLLRVEMERESGLLRLALSRSGALIRDGCLVREFAYREGCFAGFGTPVGGGLKPGRSPRVPFRPARISLARDGGRRSTP